MRSWRIYICIYVFSKTSTLFSLIFQVRALFEILEHGKISKIDANSIKKFKSENELLSRNPEKLAAWICYLQTYQSIFTKYLSLEIANGMTNLMYATTHPNATAEEIENALVIRPDSGLNSVSCKNIVIECYFTELFVQQWDYCHSKPIPQYSITK